MKVLLLLTAVALFSALCYYNQPEETSLARINRKIEAMALAEKLRQQEKYFCSVQQ